jgi:hypothetical protein
MSPPALLQRKVRPWRDGSKHWYARFQCCCGKEFEALESNVKKGNTKSCGCLRPLRRFKTHGMTGTKVYRAWRSILRRCYNPNSIQFKDWGGRGIKVCERWRHSFENFLADMGEPPTAKHSIDRIDVDGNYTPENCRWATYKEQAQNVRRKLVRTER